MGEGAEMRRLIMLLALGLAGCGESEEPASTGWTVVPDDGRAGVAGGGAYGEGLLRAVETLRPLHKSMPRPGPNDWLAQHDEPGQRFDEYLACRPSLPTPRRRVIYIQPLGEFSAKQKEIVALTVDFMGRYFNLPVKMKEALPLSVVPAEARRAHPSWGDKQILSTYVLDDVLKPRLPKDACAYIAFTTSDLWPGRGWNFVFGQASLRERVGVWSIYRFGDPEEGEAAFRLCLKRTIKVGTHETGHMFSLLHCIAYPCNMNGSNHLAESDRQPLWLCPECMAKICWMTRCDPLERYRKLAEFCDKAGLTEERDFYRKSATALAGEEPAGASEERR